jgi:hypothetical protein
VTGQKLNQAEFFEANQVDGNLTDEQAMQMLALPEGDSATAAQSSDAPDAAQDDSTPEKVVATADTESDKQSPPVVLARDGVHTIPYEQLEDARRAAQYYKQQLELVQAQAQAPARTEPNPEQPQTQKDWISPEEVSRVMGDFSESAIANGVMTLVDKRAQSMLADVEARAEAKAAERVRAELEVRDYEAAQRSHFDAINKAHPDAESIAQSQELRAWIGSQPSYAQAGIVQALQQGTSEQVIEALDAFKASTAAPKATATTTPATKPETLAAAKAAIARAKAAPPLSLSAVPAGSHAAVDELAAISEMSDAQLLKKFGALDSPGKSMALLDRIPGL